MHDEDDNDTAAERKRMDPPKAASADAPTGPPPASELSKNIKRARYSRADHRARQHETAHAEEADGSSANVVDHSHVSLEGVVMNDADRIIARSIASNQFGVMSVKNNLKTDAEVKDALEKAF